MFDAEVTDAWDASVLAHVSAEAKAQLLESAVQDLVRAGEYIEHDTRSDSPLSRASFLVVTGIIRVFVKSPTRQVTIGYPTSGDLLGIGRREITRPNIGLQALTDCRILCFSPHVLHELGHSDLTVARALCEYMIAAFVTSVDLLSENVLHPLRPRIARALLDLATREDAGLVVTAKVKDLADTVGTTRQVATRVLSDLQRDGLVRRDGRLFVLTEPGKLHEIAEARA